MDDDCINSMDLVIEEYKKHVDQTLLDESLKRTVEERIQAHRNLRRFGKSWSRCATSDKTKSRPQPA
jgi:Na+/phosphate symporter